MFSAMNAAAAGDGGAHADAAGATDDGKMMDLTYKIDNSDCYARNQASGYPWTNLLIGDSRLGFKSDADEQLILHISFQEFVKVHSLKFVEFNLGVNPEENPTKVHLYVNRENLGFEDAEDVEPEQTLELTAADLRENADNLLLKFVKFQRVKSLTFFFEDNAGGEITSLGGLKLFGRPISTTNMKDFKKNPG